MSLILLVVLARLPPTLITSTSWNPWRRHPKLIIRTYKYYKSSTLSEVINHLHVCCVSFSCFVSAAWWRPARVTQRFCRLINVCLLCAGFLLWDQKRRRFEGLSMINFISESKRSLVRTLVSYSMDVFYQTPLPPPFGALQFYSPASLQHMSN